jgi:DNA-directed RNA polymerase specialized sigma subunit
MKGRLLAAFEELGALERHIFLSRYVCNNSIKHTIEELGITEIQYQKELESCLRKLRRGPRMDAGPQFVPEPA